MSNHSGQAAAGRNHDMEDTAMAPDVHTENQQYHEVYRVSQTLGRLGQRMKIPDSPGLSGETPDY